ncbi:hypothetical protein [Massilia sp. TSP1-1-2]|uniref:hypothetical protein n=1 Tax=unclassified Massilia TaxID=2609279 RepID=UPI003CEAE74A
MPTLELNKDELIVHLKLWEALASLQRTIRIPLKNVRGATDDEGFRGLALGLRSPGTGFPGLIDAGMYRKNGDRQFVFWTRGTHPVVIELANEKWDRIILGAHDARAMAAQINAAVVQR